jgi:hypothetical protein
MTSRLELKNVAAGDQPAAASSFTGSPLARTSVIIDRT